jgi:AcrR family transcriptional regulator
MTQKQAPRRSQQERRYESDQRIIDAAIDLIGVHGYQKTTLVQIGKKAGYTGTLISNRYGSKEGLLRAVLAHILSRFVENEDERDRQTRKVSDMLSGGPEMAAVPGQERIGAVLSAVSAEKMMCDFVETYLLDVANKQSRIRALYVIIGEALGAIPEIQPEIIQVNKLFRGRVEKLVTRGISSGEFKVGAEPMQSAILIVGLLRGVTFQILAEPEKFDASLLIPGVQQAVLAGLK